MWGHPTEAPNVGNNFHSSLLFLRVEISLHNPDFAESPEACPIIRQRGDAIGDPVAKQAQTV
jgi:hypothetical protein